MHRDFVRPDCQWPPETVPTAGDLRRFDVAQAAALNGDAGGTWVPLTPITIGGQGLVLVGSGSLGHTLAGGVGTGSGGRVYLGASIYPAFSTPVARVVQTLLLVAGSVSVSQFGTVFGAVGSNSLLFRFKPRQLHNGAVVASANVSIAIGQAHVQLPAATPQVLFVRTDWAPWTTTTTWRKSTSYAAGALVVPTFAWPFVYVATGAGGTSNSSAEPNWNAAGTINASITDGSVTWVATGYTGTAPPWEPSTTALVGVNVVQPTPATGLLYLATSISGSGTSGLTQPVFPMTPGATVIDNPGANQVVWTCIGTPRAARWAASTTYKQGVRVTANPENGFYYSNATAGSNASGSSPPATWGTIVGGVTVDGAINWTCIGTNPIGAGSLPTPANPDAYYDGGVTQTLSVPCYGATTIDTANYAYGLVLKDEAGIGSFESFSSSQWLPASPYTSNVVLSGSSRVQPNPPNGYYYECIGGNATPIAGAWTSDATPPAWPIVLGATVAESGSTAPLWQCVGPATPSLNVFVNVALSFTSIDDMRPE